MLLTTATAALQLLFACRLLDESEADVLIGSDFPEDVSELHLVQTVNRIKHAMAAGRTIVLVNHDNMHVLKHILPGLQNLQGHCVIQPGNFRFCAFGGVIGVGDNFDLRFAFLRL